jgi:tetratricopeptide (TPR) repeat protein
LLKQVPENIEGMRLKALALNELNRPSEALALLDQAATNNELPLPMILDRVRILARAKGPTEALATLEKLGQTYPEDPVVLAMLTRALVESGQTDRAISSAQKALRLGEDIFDRSDLAYLNRTLGRLQRRSGQLDQAIHHLSEAISYDPLSLEAYLELGQAYLDRRDYPEALNVFQNAISIKPDEARIYYLAGITFKEVKDYPEAETMLRRAAELSPTDLSIHRQLGAVVALNIVYNSREAAVST